MTSCVKLWVHAHRTGKGVSQLSGRGGSTNLQRARPGAGLGSLRLSGWLVAGMTGRMAARAIPRCQRGQPPGKKSGRRCRIGAGVFVAGVRAAREGRPGVTGDDPRCSTWFP